MSSVPERTDDERGHPEHLRLLLPDARQIDDDGLDALVGCYRSLVAIARREGLALEPERASDIAAEPPTPGTTPLSPRAAARARAKHARRLAAEAER